jgi:hypothetical protein
MAMTSLSRQGPLPIRKINLNAWNPQNAAGSAGVIVTLIFMEYLFEQHVLGARRFRGLRASDTIAVCGGHAGMAGERELGLAVHPFSEDVAKINTPRT